MAEQPVTTAGTDQSAEEEQTRTEPDQRLLRALADLDNLRKRLGREVARERADERARVASMWLPLVDDLERALEYGVSADDALVAGVRAVYEQALAVLERLGFPRFEDLGKPFDPTRQEAVGAVESDAPPDTVAATTRPGYGSDTDILRPASVIVARRPE
jgi:molecular chaperone GrpE